MPQDNAAAFATFFVCGLCADNKMPQGGVFRGALRGERAEAEMPQAAHLLLSCGLCAARGSRVLRKGNIRAGLSFVSRCGESAEWRRASARDFFARFVCGLAFSFAMREGCAG